MYNIVEEGITRLSILHYSSCDTFSLAHAAILVYSSLIKQAPPQIRARDKPRTLLVVSSSACRPDGLVGVGMRKYNTLMEHVKTLKEVTVDSPCNTTDTPCFLLPSCVHKSSWFPARSRPCCFFVYLVFVMVY